jgi:phosphoribosylformylglycinamidine synthase subunit PurS
MITAKIKIMPKPGVLDPQGKTVMQSLETLGFRGIDEVRIGKYIEIKLDHKTKTEAETEIRTMCEKLLSNPVIESFDVDLI